MFNLAAVALALITIHVQAAFIMAPEVKFRVHLDIPIATENRMAIVEWDGEGELSNSGSTSRQLDEFTDKTRHTFYIMLTPGKYYIRGRLIRNDGEHVSETKTVEILESLPQQ